MARSKSAVEVADALERSHDPDPKVRRKALHDLCPCEVRAHLPEVWERIFELSTDDDVAVRKAALHAMCDGSPPEYRTDIVHALEWYVRDRDAKIRKAAQNVLRSYRRTGKLNVL